MPRTGALEVSYRGMLIFSKLNGGYWPNCELIAEKCEMVVRNEATGADCSAYLAGNTPIKGGGYVQSSAKKSTRGSSPQRGNKMNQMQQVHYGQGFGDGEGYNNEPLRSPEKKEAPSLPQVMPDV